MKKLICLLALLCLLPTAFSDTHFWNSTYLSNTTMFYATASNASNWVNGSEEQEVPITGDDIVFNATSLKNCSWDIQINALSLTLNTGYSGTLVDTINDFNVTGNVILNNGTFSPGQTKNVNIGGNWTEGGASVIANNAVYYNFTGEGSIITRLGTAIFMQRVSAVANITYTSASTTMYSNGFVVRPGQTVTLGAGKTLHSRHRVSPGESFYNYGNITGGIAVQLTNGNIRSQTLALGTIDTPVFISHESAQTRGYTYALISNSLLRSNFTVSSFVNNTAGSPIYFNTYNLTVNGLTTLSSNAKVIFTTGTVNFTDGYIQDGANSSFTQGGNIAANEMLMSDGVFSGNPSYNITLTMPGNFSNNTGVSNANWRLSSEATTLNVFNGFLFNNTLNNTNFWINGTNFTINRWLTIPNDRAGYANISRYLNISSIGNNASISLNITYLDTDYITGSETTLDTHRYNLTAWNKLGGTVDTVNNRVVSNSTLFGIFAPMYGTAPIITFLNQSPLNITTTALLAERLSINYTITDAAGLNLTTIKMWYNSTPYVHIINGTTEAIPKWFPYYYNVSSTFYFDAGQRFYPAICNLDLEDMENTTHISRQLNTSSSYYKMSFLNFTTTYPDNFLEVMINSTGAGQLVRVYACNSSYTTGNVQTSANCVQVYDILNNTLFNHTHPNEFYTANLSFHQYVPLYINSTAGTVNGLKATSTMQFMLKHTAVNPKLLIYGVTGTVRPGAFALSTNNGNTWSNDDAFIPDSHIHQFNASSMSASYWAEACNINGGCTNSSTKSTNGTSTLLPPSSPVVFEPTLDTYNGNISINYTAAYSSTGIAYYNISLVNLDGSFNKTITSNNYLNLTYLWNSLTTQDGMYRVNVKAVANSGLSSSGQSFEFTLNNSNTTSIMYIVSGGAIGDKIHVRSWVYQLNTSTNITSGNLITDILRPDSTIITVTNTYNITSKFWESDEVVLTQSGSWTFTWNYNGIGFANSTNFTIFNVVPSGGGGGGGGGGYIPPVNITPNVTENVSGQNETVITIPGTNIQLHIPISGYSVKAYLGSSIYGVPISIISPLILWLISGLIFRKKRILASVLILIGISVFVFFGGIDTILAVLANLHW